MQFEILNASIENAHSLGRSGKLINLKYTNAHIMQFMASRWWWWRWQFTFNFLPSASEREREREIGVQQHLEWARFIYFPLCVRMRFSCCVRASLIDSTDSSEEIGECKMINCLRRHGASLFSSLAPHAVWTRRRFHLIALGCVERERERCARSCSWLCANILPWFSLVSESHQEDAAPPCARGLMNLLLSISARLSFIRREMLCKCDMKVNSRKIVALNFMYNCRVIIVQ